MSDLPGVVQGGFQDGENSVCRGAALTNAVGAAVSLAVVRLAAGLGTREGWFGGKAAVPVLNLFCC